MRGSRPSTVLPQANPRAWLAPTPAVLTLPVTPVSEFTVITIAWQIPEETRSLSLALIQIGVSQESLELWAVMTRQIEQD